MVRRLHSASSSFEGDFARLVDGKRGVDENVDDVVLKIISDVRARGDDAVVELTNRFDRIAIGPDKLRISDDEIDSLAGQCEASALAALDLAAQRILDFHERQLPKDDESVDRAGVRLGLRWTPLDSAGLYVPGGTAAYPSSVLMNAIPAKVAGVARLVMTVPTPGGAANPLVMAAARRAGVDEIYRIGGAQAVAALAYGTATIEPVDKIVGPGNAYVAAAKRRVFGQVGIDMMAGPSEILVVADAASDPAWIAIDLLSQAEHDAEAQAILITDDESYADAVENAIDRHLDNLPRSSIARASWDGYGAIIVVESFDQVPPLVDRLAPEHLELAVAEPLALAEKVRHAGAIFLGRHTPEAIGDYVAGPNHVLPTSRSARFASGLGVLDFMKRTTWVECDAASLEVIGPSAVTLAELEGLDAHARSISIRLDDKST